MSYATSLAVIAMLLGGIAALADESVDDNSPPLSEKQLAELNQTLETSLERATELVRTKPDSVDSYSRRGDIRFFLGQFTLAVEDYDKMVELDASLDSSHWRRGIALFYAERYEDAAKQFERYHSFDQIDRENGIWRYLSQRKAFDLETARNGLLKYKKDDREPFPAVYQLFAGSIEPQQILDQIAEAKISTRDRDMRLFYANLYIGLNFAVEKNDKAACQHLAMSTRNPWGPAAGYGPAYMWHVGRLHESLLRKKLAEK